MRPTTERIEIKYVLDCPLQPRVTPTKLYCDVKKKVGTLSLELPLGLGSIPRSLWCLRVWWSPTRRRAKKPSKTWWCANTGVAETSDLCFASHSIKEESIKFYRHVCLRPVQIGRPKNIGSSTKIYGKKILDLNIIACTLLHYCHRHKTQCILSGNGNYVWAKLVHVAFFFGKLKNFNESTCRRL